MRLAPPVPPLLLAVAVSLALVLTGAGEALAAGKITRAGSVLTVDAGTGTFDGIQISRTATHIRLLLEQQTSLELESGGCAPAGAGTIDCPPDVTRLVVKTHDANDVVQMTGSVPVQAVVEVELGSGGDVFEAPAQTDTVIARGGDGDDFLTTGPGNDVLAGGSGSDTLRPARGLDDVGGGDGHDLVSYDDRTVPLRVSLDGFGNDGDPAVEERDNVAADVEHVIGGSVADVLVGNDGANELEAADGDDTLDGRGGVDRYSGGNGADTVLARDGLAERIACGEGSDSAVVDDIDTTSGCEVVESSPELQPDRDGDGIDAPGDCNDLVASVRPGAFDSPDNGVDEDCSGADAVNSDRDLDGFPRGLDCDDSTAAIRPGGVEVFGNGPDEDCNGISEPFPVFESRVRLSSLVFREPSYTKVTGLLLTALGDGDRIVVRCKGKGCPMKARRPKPPKGGGDLAYGKRFKGARLKPGAKLVVRITRADGVGATTRYKIRDAKPPKRTVKCFNPLDRSARC